MSNLNIPLFSQICKTPGAPGFEKPIRDFLMKELTPLVDDLRIDSIGNIIALKKGRSSEKKAMVAAHMDEIGFIVTHIDSNGFIRFAPLGGFDPKTLTAQRVIIHGKKDLIGVMGSKPIHIMKPEERKKNPILSDYFIDLGMDQKSVKKVISIGDPITRLSDLLELGDCLNCKSLDNRASVFILLETLRGFHQNKETPAYDLYATFTVQEEVGLRGAQASALDIQPDFGFGLDTTIAYDVPGSQEHEQVTALGNGAAIKLMDSSSICDYRMVAYMKKIAQDESIKHQTEILLAGGTDTASLQRMTPGGSIAGAISIPTRHIHQSVEMLHKNDLQDCIDLLTACLNGLDQYDWAH